jgi:hypothetical protein
LWKRAFSREAGGVRLLAIPGELASGGVISRRRSLGIFLSMGWNAEHSHDDAVVDDLLKNLIRLWTTSLEFRG